MDTEVDWALSCLGKAEGFVTDAMLREQGNSNSRFVIDCLFEAKLNINRAIEAITDSGVGRAT